MVRGYGRQTKRETERLSQQSEINRMIHFSVMRLMNELRTTGGKKNIR